MNSWDDEDYEPEEPKTAAAVGGGLADRWSGEDEDEDGLMDNWDDDPVEKETSGVPKSQPKKKKTLAEKIAEKEEAKKAELLARMAEQEESREMTEAEKQAAQLESDLEIARENLGFGDEVLPGVKTIDNFEPKSKDDFIELSAMIVEKLSKLEYKSDYGFFLETLVRDSCAGREPEDIKKISNTLTLLANEKQKLNKADKNKAAATKKNTLASGKGVGKMANDDYDDYYNE